MTPEQLSSAIAAAIEGGSLDPDGHAMAVLNDDKLGVAYVYEVVDVKIDRKSNRLAVMLG